MKHLMRLYSRIITCSVFCLLCALPAKAQSNVGYYGFEPDIVANYISTSNKKLGYIRVTVDLMLTDVGDITLVEHHMPLLRDALVEILSQETEANIKSLTAREEIRQKALARLKELLKAETGKEIIQDLLFTKYLYQ